MLYRNNFESGMDFPVHYHNGYKNTVIDKQCCVAALR